MSVPFEVSRRSFLQRGVAFSMGFAGLKAMLGPQMSLARAMDGAGSHAGIVGGGYGPLLADPKGILDLPAGFSYQVIARAGEAMDDGLVVPARADGMAAFAAPSGNTIVVCNHEIESAWKRMSPFGEQNQLLRTVDVSALYDAGHGIEPSIGGCSTIVYDTRARRLVKHSLTLAGTNRNCAGGPTPWGSWLTCEEDDVRKGMNHAEQDHGWVFEVPAREEIGLIRPEPIKAMGRFVHEAICIDPRTGIVYLTEDDKAGLLYRFIPAQRQRLLAGGRLQALCLVDAPSAITSNAPGQPLRIGVGQRLPCRWIDLDEVHAPKSDLRIRGFAAGAAQFARGEGMWWGQAFRDDGQGREIAGGAYFAATTGGEKGKGQLWKYVPSASEGQPGEAADPGMLELFVEPNDSTIIENADNITVAPWGDLFVCEDGTGGEDIAGNRLLHVTPRGRVSTFARNARSDGELAGVCFAPDGSTMFVNLQIDGLTLAVHGPWKA